MIIKKACQFCNKTTELESEIDLGESGKLLVFKCGHSYVESVLASLEQTKNEETKEIELSLYQKLVQAVPEWCEKHERKCIKTITSHSGKHLFPYQRDGIVKAIKNNAKFIFADEMGLGKTVQGLVTILLEEDKLLPAIFVCKSIAKTNWLWETMDWLKIPAQVIFSSSETPFDMFKVHIVSHDMVNRLDKMFKFSEMKDQVECPECQVVKEVNEFMHEGVDCPNCSKIKRTTGDQDSKNETEVIERDGKITTISKVIATGTIISEQKKVIPRMTFWYDKSIGPGSSLRDQNKIAWFNTIKNCKTVIIDESHLIKNPESQRSKAVKKLCSRIPHVLGMSGTLIKNNATEYFTILNIVKPEKFWRYNSFCYNHVKYEFVKTAIGWSQKFTGLKDPEGFKEMCKDFMIRRITDEVLPELPKLFKQQKYVELDEKFREIYNESESEFAKWFDSASSVEIRTNLLAQLAILRHQTSIAKIDFTIDLALEFIMSCSGKLAIFTHHIDARNIIADRMDTFFKETGHPLTTMLGRGQNVQEEIEEFKKSESRILILSTLSHGESINLQFCSNSILHERQWNPANEDQAISGRFRRIGQEAPHINCMIPVALGTIDEYFVELVERKRGISKEIDEGQQEAWNAGFVAELAEKIASRGRERWKL